MKPENEVERQEAMQAAKSKKTFQKVVAANDAFEFCRSAPSAPCAWRKRFAAGGQILFAQCLFTPFLPPDARSDTCSRPASVLPPSRSLSISLSAPPGVAPQGELSHIEHEHGARQRLH